MQSLLALSADVFQESNANPRSFGFRVGRSAAMAVSYIHLLAG
jgi:retron-type reverse transcriptase